MIDAASSPSFRSRFVEKASSTYILFSNPVWVPPTKNRLLCYSLQERGWCRGTFTLEILGRPALVSWYPCSEVRQPPGRRFDHAKATVPGASLAPHQGHRQTEIADSSSCVRLGSEEASKELVPLPPHGSNHERGSNDIQMSHERRSIIVSLVLWVAWEIAIGNWQSGCEQVLLFSFGECHQISILYRFKQANIKH